MLRASTAPPRYYIGPVKPLPGYPGPETSYLYELVGDLMGDMADALVSMGFFAALADAFTDLFSGSQLAFNKAAHSEIKRRCDRNLHDVDAILPILENCVRFARGGR